MLHVGREGSCKFFFSLYADCMSIIISIVILVCMSSVHEIIWMTQLLGCCADNVGYTGKCVTAFMLCHHSRDLCLGWRWALSEAGTVRGARVARAHRGEHTGSPKGSWSKLQVWFAAGCLWVCISLQELRCFVKLAVVAPRLPFASSVACLLPQVTRTQESQRVVIIWECCSFLASSRSVQWSVKYSRETERKLSVSEGKSAVVGFSALKWFGRNWWRLKAMNGCFGRKHILHPAWLVSWPYSASLSGYISHFYC